MVTTGSARSGLGHVRRCLALARALDARGCSVEFSSDSSDAEDMVRRAAFSVSAPGPLRRSVDHDLIVLDSYEITPQFADDARGRCKVLVAIEDLPDRRLPVHMTIDVGAAIEPAGTPPAPRGPVLSGPRFALLDEPFSHPPQRTFVEKIARVLIIVGGTDQRGLLAPFVDVVTKTFPRATVDVVIGPFVAHEVEKRVAASDAVRTWRNPEAMRPLMLGADLALSAAGQTLLELAACATPTIAVELVENQSRLLSVLARSGATYSAGRWCDADLLSTVSSALRQFADVGARTALGRRARATVDGLGAARCAATIVERLTAHAAHA